MNSYLKKLIAFLTSVILLFSAGCGRGSSPAHSGQDGAIKPAEIDTAIAEDGGVVILRKNALSLPDAGVSIQYTAMAGKYIYLCGEDSHGEYRFYRMGEDLRISRLDMSYDEPIENFAADDSGTVFLLNTDNDGKKRIVCFDGEGVRREITPGAIADEGIIFAFAAMEGGFLVDNMREILALDREGNLIKSFGEYPGGVWLVRLGDSKAFAIYGSSAANSPGGLESNRRIDRIDGQFNIIGSAELNAAYSSFFGGTDAELFTSLEGSLYEYDYNTGAVTKKFDAAGNSLVPEYYLGDDRYFAVERGAPVILTAERDDGVKRLVLAGYHIDARLERAAQAFNSTNSGYIITLDDYARYDEFDNQDAGFLRFSADIISGNTPDIYDLSNVSPEQYAARGLLEELTPYFEADSDVGTDALYDKLVELTAFNGGMYQLIPAFSVQAICGAADIISPDFTTEKLLDLAAAYSPQELFGERVTRGWFIREVLMSMHEELYSTEDRSCHFDTEEFASMLKIAASLPAETDAAISEYAKAASGEQLLLLEWFGPFFVDYIAIYNTIFGGEVCITGFPSGRGHGAAILPQLPLGMSAESENKDGVWAFFRFLLGDSFQQDFFGSWFFPANKIALERFIEEYITCYIDRPMTFFTGGEEHLKLTGTLDNDAARTAAYALFDGIDSLAAYDSAIYNIVMDSCGALFAGDKTAEETAAAIQSRASIYMAEQYG